MAATRSSKIPLLPIGEVAARAGVRPSALRFYEEEGILAPAGREGGKRRYAPAVVDQVRFIRLCQQLGFNLAEIRELLTPPRGVSAKRRWRQLVETKMKELDDAVAHAHAARKVLAESRECDCVTLETCRYLNDALTDATAAS